MVFDKLGVGKVVRLILWRFALVWFVVKGEFLDRYIALIIEMHSARTRVADHFLVPVLNDDTGLDIRNCKRFGLYLYPVRFDDLAFENIILVYFDDRSVGPCDTGGQVLDL